MRTLHHILVGSVAVTPLAACGDDSTGPGDLAPVASLAITAIPDTLLTRESLELEAKAFDRHGSPLPDRPVAWESSDPMLVSVTAGGVVTAVAPGTATLRATTEGIADSVTVTVRTLQLAHIYPGIRVSCGLEASGEAWCWGKIGSTGYGNGSLDSTYREVPARAAIGHTFTGLALGRESACGFDSSGGVLCWGQNESGQLGDGSTAPHGVPAPVTGLTGIVELAAGSSHYCARSNSGAVSCWGANEWLESGQPARGVQTRPASVTLPGPAAQIIAGTDHSCALVAGNAFCWGADHSRQLGNDTTYHRLVPTLAATGDGVTRTWSEVEASSGHTCGRDVGGAVFCWGRLDGQGDADTLVWLPTRRFSGIRATDIAGGWFVQCAVTDQQRARCDGQTFPLAELTASGGVTSVVVAGAEACVLLTDGAVECELGTGTRGRLTDAPLPSPAVQLAASDGMVCALDEVAAVYCWSTWDRLVPQRAFETLTVTGVHGNSGGRVCVTAQGSVVACRSWYDGEETTEPTGGLAFVTLAVGDNHTCGLTAAGSAWCWGQNSNGQLGDGSTTARTSPVAVQGGHVFTGITAGYSHTCAITTAGAMYCWGEGSWGTMGDDNRDESADPLSVDGTPRLTRLGAGPHGTCGLDAAGSVWCWSRWLVFGDPLSYGRPGVQQVEGATGLAATTAACGLRSGGEMLCWGTNGAGWFGDGTFQTPTETAVPGGDGIRFSELRFSLTGTACGIALDGSNYCWGNAFGGSLGSPDSNRDMATLPLRMYGSP